MPSETDNRASFEVFDWLFVSVSLSNQYLLLPFANRDNFLLNIQTVEYKAMAVQHAQVQLNPRYCRLKNTKVLFIY